MNDVNAYDFFVYLVHKNIQVKIQEKLAGVTSCLFSCWWRFGLAFAFVSSFVVFGLFWEFWGELTGGGGPGDFLGWLFCWVSVIGFSFLYKM